MVILAVVAVLWIILPVLLMAFIGALFAIMLRGLANLVQRYLRVPTEPLFPVVKEHLGQLIGREAAQQFGGCCSPGRGRARFRVHVRVEPHVERSLGGEAEPAAVHPGKLVGRKPQVQKHALD